MISTTEYGGVGWRSLEFFYRPFVHIVETTHIQWSHKQNSYDYKKMKWKHSSKSRDIEDFICCLGFCCSQCIYYIRAFGNSFAFPSTHTPTVSLKAEPSANKTLSIHIFTELFSLFVRSGVMLIESLAFISRVFGTFHLCLFHCALVTCRRIWTKRVEFWQNV